MAGATIWIGKIHFGDTNVPVKLHSAVREQRVQFHLLHQPDRVRLRQKMVCAYENQPVPSEEQSKGFEVEEGKYVLFEPSELEQTVPESSRTIEVNEFVKTEEIDPIFLDRIYYLEPHTQDIQGKEYRTLLKVLKDLGAAGICSWTMRRRSYFGALLAWGKTLRLSTLRYGHEVIPADTLDLPDVDLSEKELQIGAELIEKFTAPFEPGKFENEHQRKLKDMIEKKARGEKISVLKPKHLKATRSDQLLRALEERLKQAA